MNDILYIVVYMFDTNGVHYKMKQWKIAGKIC